MVWFHSCLLMDSCTSSFEFYWPKQLGYVVGIHKSIEIIYIFQPPLKKDYGGSIEFFWGNNYDLEELSPFRPFLCRSSAPRIYSIGPTSICGKLLVK